MKHGTPASQHMFDPHYSPSDADPPKAMPAYQVEFTISGVPIAKGRPRFSARLGRDGKHHARAYTPERTRTYEEVVREAGRAAMNGLKATSNAVGLELVVFVPIPASWPKGKRAKAMAGLLYPTSRPDLDNYEKAVTDGLNGIVYEDDSQICDVIKGKRYSDRPRVYVRAWSLEGFE